MTCQVIEMKKEKVIVYIDGFNLYFGLKEKKWKKFYWLNLKKLAKSLVKKEQILVYTKYFTSRIKHPPDKVKRQGTFIEALEVLSNFKIFYGQYQSHKKECSKCENITEISNEKMTDVNIAVEMLKDAYQNKFDTAILISADSDLSSPIITINELFPEKKVIIAFPPARFSFMLNQIANHSITIGRRKFEQSILPENITKKDGYVLKRPITWK